MIESLTALDTTTKAMLTSVLGLLFGSFLNVVIYRLPLDESPLKGRSLCPQCKFQLPWFCNIPVLSYLFLRGRCVNCQAKISVQYPLVELATAFLFLWNYETFGWSTAFLFYTVFLCLLLAISVIDLHHRIIPDELSLSGIVLGILSTFFLNDISWVDSVIGVLVGGGVFWGVAFFYEKFAKREGLGGGDVKLLAMLGAWLGYQSVLIIVILSTSLGSVVGIAVMWLQRTGLKAAIPFGPFLSVAGIVYLFWREPLLQFFFPRF